jgi:hypothetical protein
MTSAFLLRIPETVGLVMLIWWSIKYSVRITLWASRTRQRIQNNGGSWIVYMFRDLFEAVKDGFFKVLSVFK